MLNLDPDYLLSLAQSRKRADRAALAETIVDLFADDGSSLSDRERALMFEILHKIVLEVEVAVRQSVSDRLADMDDVPPALIKDLANDTVDVAYPILTRSRVLQDDDLIEIVRFRTLEHQLAIAMRYAVSERVSATLAEEGDDGIIEALLRNPNARIAQSTMSYLVEQSRRVDTYQEPLLQRREMSPDLAKRMFLWVSAALRRHIIERFGMDEAIVESLLEAAACEQIASFRKSSGSCGSELLANELADAGLLQPEMMVKALAQAEIDLFVGMFARAADLRRRVVLRILFDDGGTGLAIASKGIGLDRKSFSQIFTFSRATKPRRGTGARAQRALDVFDTIASDQAQRVLARWRLDPEFTAAIEAIEQERVHA